jgi:hypothetical protein
MTPIQLATLIGNILTQIDSKLADPQFPSSDPNWQTLYALRKHLDDLQRDLIKANIAVANPAYPGLTKKIADACAEIKAVIKNADEVNRVLKDVSAVAGLVDQVLKLIP